MDLAATLTGWRRHLHENPELSLQESDTAAFVRKQLDALGIPYVAGVGGHGVVATLSRGHGNGQGNGKSNRAVGLRADMDALPIAETTGLPYASRRAGIMHACGHDGHTTSLLGAAVLLSQDPGWTGTIHLVFQPAEEGYGGAKSMLADGLLQRFPMERIFGYHNMPGIAAGTLVVHDGPVMAAGARLDLTIRGHAGHAAMPHLTRDPMVALGHLLVALQTVVARTVDPLDSAVVSIGSVQGGVAANQIPAEVVLRGTFRTYRPGVRDLVEGTIRQIAAGIAQTFGVEIRVDVAHGVSATVNTKEEGELAAAAGADAGLPVCRDVPPSMAGEDFGWYLEQRPGAFAWIGNGPSGGGRELHNPNYDFNDAILPAAAGWLAAVAKRALGE